MTGNSSSILKIYLLTNNALSRSKRLINVIYATEPEVMYHRGRRSTAVSLAISEIQRLCSYASKEVDHILTLPIATSSDGEDLISASSYLRFSLGEVLKSTNSQPLNVIESAVDNASIELKVFAYSRIPVEYL
jgi:hypothetical protein